STSTASQLRTIVSRCQVVRFDPLPEAIVADLLRTQGVEDPALLERLVRLADGSPGVGLTLADPALWQFREVLLTGICRPPVASVELAKQWQECVEQAGKDSAVQRQRARVVVRFLVDFLGQALALSVGGPLRRMDAGDRPLLEALVRGQSA